MTQRSAWPAPRPGAVPPADPAMFHVLVALADEDRHGYAIIKDVARQRRRRRLGTGTLYGIVKRLLAEGWSSIGAAACGGP